MRKRRNERKAAKVARMLVSLDDEARQVRPRPAARPVCGDRRRSPYDLAARSSADGPGANRSDSSRWAFEPSRRPSSSNTALASGSRASAGLRHSALSHAPLEVAIVPVEDFAHVQLRRTVPFH
jgi:hypothetical protein